MRDSLVQYLRCPRCHTERLRLSPTVRRDAREIRQGSVACDGCAQVYPIEAGIIDLLYDPPDFVKREAAGLARFAEAMRQGGWDRKKILSLPHLDDDAYWAAQATSMEQILASVAFQPGERLLDVGSNTCWASNIFARRGLEVLALDIATTEMSGLGTAEYFFEGTDICFDRVVGIMFALPFASGSFDYVFCCEVLHHNDPRTLRQTFRECHRVLKPGGRLLVLNETLRTLLESSRPTTRCSTASPSCSKPRRPFSGPSSSWAPS